MLIIIEGRGPGTVASPDMVAGGESTPEPETTSVVEETTAAAEAVDIPEDYVCTAYDIAQFEQLAGDEANEAYFVTNAYSTYLDVIGDMLYCTFMVGWPADNDEIELTVEVWTEPDIATASDSFGWDRGNWETATGGIVEDYSGLEGEGFIYESEDSGVFMKVELLNDTSIATATMQSSKSLDMSQTRSILLDMIEQAWVINAANPR